MVKVCAITNCPTGHYKDFKRHKELGVRQASMFNVPRAINARREWSNAVRQVLTDKDRLCEFHFQENDIIKSDRTVMPDGTVNIIPRIKYSLVRGAIPKKINDGFQQVPLEHMEFNEQANCAVADVLDEQQPIVTFGSTNAQQKNLSDVINIQDDRELDNIADTRGFADHLLATSSDDCSIDNVVADTVGIDEEMHQSETPSLTLQVLIKHLRCNPLPQTWSWMNNPREDNSVVLTQLDPTTCKIRFHLDIDRDLSVKLRTSDGKVCSDLEMRVASVRDVMILLERVEVTQQCHGTGIDTDSRSEGCPAFVDPDDYTRRTQEPRCTACRMLRRKLLNRRHRIKTNVKVRYSHSKRLLDLKHRKLKRLKIKVRRFELRILQEKRRCAAVNEQALTTAISKLPPVQQEAVRACFSSAKVGNAL